MKRLDNTPLPRKLMGEKSAEKRLMRTPNDANKASAPQSGGARDEGEELIRQRMVEYERFETFLIVLTIYSCVLLKFIVYLLFMKNI
jgi:hypothetical protein